VTAQQAVQQSFDTWFPDGASVVVGELHFYVARVMVDYADDDEVGLFLFDVLEQNPPLVALAEKPSTWSGHLRLVVNDDTAVPSGTIEIVANFPKDLQPLRAEVLESNWFKTLEEVARDA
jgi:hypothetical protein